MSRRVHPTEQQLGYYRKYRTRNGEVLRYIRMQAGPRELPEDDITPWRLLGLVVFVLGMVAVLVYALPIVLIGLFGGAA